METLTDPPRREIWLVYHVPKTGGQTLRYHLRRELGPEAHIHLGRFERDLPLVTVDDLSGPAATSIRVVTGHPVVRAMGGLFPGSLIHDVLVLRDPVDRVVSHWMFQAEFRRRSGKPPRGFSEFVAWLGPNPMTRQVAEIVGETRPDRALDAALLGLDRITVVGTLDRLDELMPPLLAAMGLAPVLPPRTNRSGHEIPLLARPPQDELDAWLRTNRGDTILYAAARQFDDRSLERLRELVRPNGSS